MKNRVIIQNLHNGYFEAGNPVFSRGQFKASSLKEAYKKSMELLVIWGEYTPEELLNAQIEFWA